ncbi:hypothetical protein ABH944_008549 [Caballeronia udeis]|uniref:Nitroreductase n=1 Tax=Caballeronia udeis TaxID=1232866 RepID=A0ABW8MXM2_9BURK
MSKSGKSKRARLAAERLFPELEVTPVSAEAGAGSEAPFERDRQRISLRPERPFGDDFAWLKESDDEDDAASIVTLPRGIEVPTGYDSVDHVREALRRAWRIEWGNFEANTVDISLPYGWTVNSPKEGPFNIIDRSGVPRATYDRSPHAKLHLLTCCWLDQELHPNDGYCRLVVRDRESSSILESSCWTPETGKDHPEWSRMQAWMDQHCPHYEDPLRGWEDCEENNDRWLDPIED